MIRRASSSTSPLGTGIRAPITSRRLGRGGCARTSMRRLRCALMSSASPHPPHSRVGRDRPVSKLRTHGKLVRIVYSDGTARKWRLAHPIPAGKGRKIHSVPYPFGLAALGADTFYPLGIQVRRLAARSPRDRSLRLQVRCAAMAHRRRPAPGGGGRWSAWRRPPEPAAAAAGRARPRRRALGQSIAAPPWSGRRSRRRDPRCSGGGIGHGWMERCSRRSRCSSTGKVSWCAPAR